MLAPDEISVRDTQITPDGRRLFILRGTRWVDHPDGSLERARQIFEEEDVKATALPPHLGGGFVFHVNSGPATLIWRAPTWTADLQPVGRVEPPFNEISPGFDRLYLGSATSYTLRALDPNGGQARDLEPLPPAASYGPLLFADPRFGVVLAGVRGALASFDAGVTWRPVATTSPVNDLTLTPSGSISLGTDAGRFELNAAGQLLPSTSAGADPLFKGAQSFVRYPEEAFPRHPPHPALHPGPLGRRPLRAAVTSGWPDTATTAIVVDGGAVGRVRLSDGALLDSQPFTGATPCRGIALGTGFGFACGDALGPTEVYAYRQAGLQLELRLDGPHRVRSSGNGALVIDAPCNSIHEAADSDVPALAPEHDAAELGRHCVRSVSGKLFEVQVRGDVGAERIAALADGRVAVIVPPRSNAPGRLSIIGPGGSTDQPLSLEPGSGPGARLVRSGTWLDELWEVAPGKLGAWVVGAQAFVGVRLDLEGVVQIARLEDGVEETSFYGPHALQIAASASLRESLDQGFDWKVSEVPPALLAAGLGRVSKRPLRGCSAVGCIRDDWVRIGYSAEALATEPVRPPTPTPVAYPAPGFAFWTLDCALSGNPPSSGRADGAARRVEPSSEKRHKGTAGRARGPAPTEPPESSSWIAFEESTAPVRAATDLGYDFGETTEAGAYHAYAWGPTRGDWLRHGRWSVKVGDQFSLAAPWSTSVTHTPWADPITVAQVFGLDPNTGVDWWLRLGATGQSGLLQIRVHSDSTVHLLDRDRGITTLLPPAGVDLGALAGAYEAGDRWYLGATRAEQFQLYRVEDGRLELVATYPLYSRLTTQLIRSVHGDELALWQKSSGSGWYVTPLDLETFEAKPAFHLASASLGRVPPQCAAGQPGWLGVSGVPLTDANASESNTHLDFSGEAEGLRTKRLQARVVINESGVCVDALAALSDGPARVDLRAAEAGGQAGLPLVVTDPTDDRRLAFRCKP
jgi:hypothetical protein